MTYVVTVNYGPEDDAPILEYSEVILVEWRNENWLRLIFKDGSKTLLDASKCYSIDIEQDEEEENNNYQ
jgi:hypothetical protein